MRIFNNMDSPDYGTKPILIFGFDIDLYEGEIENKGYCSDVIVQLADSSRFKICFYDPVRIVQDLEEEKYIAEPGLIIINGVNRKNMETAIYQVWLNGYFDTQIPIVS